MKVSKEVAAGNAVEVLKAASHVMRSEGIAAASMGAIAARAGLTHGAIYRHFNNKDELAASAIMADFDKIVILLQDLLLEGGGAASYIKTYLTRGHRDRFEWGCPVAPLAAEIQRDAPLVQAAFCDGLQRNIAALATCVKAGTKEERRKTAIVVLATLSGAMAMARATRERDPRLSLDILNDAREALMAFVSPSQQGQ